MISNMLNDITCSVRDQIYLIDCLKGMEDLSEKSIDVIVTSPPYNLNINYGKYKDNKPRTEYLNWLESVFVACKRVLKDEGHLFVNIGYSNVDPWVGMDVANRIRNHFVLQNSIAWVKSIHVGDKTSGHFKPINSQRFITPTWENLFHFTKSGSVVVNRLGVGVPYEYYKENLRNGKTASTKPNLRCKGNTWFIPYETVNSKEIKGKHPAVFPVQLVSDCIKLSGVKEGIVLDPFMGTGTTAVAAIKNQLFYIGYEIDSDYQKFAIQRIEKERATLL